MERALEGHREIQRRASFGVCSPAAQDRGQRYSSSRPLTAEPSASSTRSRCIFKQFVSLSNQNAALSTLFKGVHKETGEMPHRLASILYMELWSFL